MKQTGFSLAEMLVALAISSVLLLSAARLLPVLQRNNLQTLMRFQLQEELQLMMFTLEKSVLRAGYCRGECRGQGLTLGADGHCLLVRWDENSNGKWEGVESSDSDFYGYRWRDGSLETQRGVDRCDGGGWERLNDPRTVTIESFRATQVDRQIRLAITAFAKAFPSVRMTVEHWLTAANL